MPEAPTPTKSRKHNLLTTLALVAALFAITLTLLPHAIGYGIKELIKTQGGEQITLGNVDFNPFTAALRIEDLRISRETKEQLILPELELHLEWLPLWKKQVVITGLSLSDVEMQLLHDTQGKQITVGGMLFDLFQDESAERGTAWNLKLDQIKLKQVSLTYRAPQLSTQLTVNELTLKGINTADTEEPLSLDFEGAIEKASVKLHGELTPLSAAPAFTGEVSIKDLTLAPYSQILKSRIDQIKGILTTKGKLSIQQHATQLPETTYNGTLTLNDFLVADSHHNLSGSGLIWKGNLQIKPDNALVEGSLNTKNIQYQNNADLSYQHAKTDWSGRLTLHSKAEENTIKGSGKLILMQPDLKLVDNHISIEQIELALQQGSIILSKDDLQLTHTGELKLIGTNIASAESTLFSESTEWDGLTELKQTQAGIHTATNGTLNSRSFQLSNTKDNTTIGYTAIDWHGQLEIDQTAERIEVNPTGDLRIEGLKATDLSAELGLLAVDSINLKQLNHPEPGQVAADQMQLNAITIGSAPNNEKQRPQLFISTVTLRQPSFSPNNGLVIAHIDATGLQQQVRRNANKSWNHDRLIDAISRWSSSKEDQNSPPAEMLPIQIGQITLEGDSLINFHDQTTEPAYQTRLRPTRLTIVDINSRTPEKPSNLTLKGILGESSTVDFTGTVRPFATKPTFDLKGRIEGLELPTLSAYTIPLMGYKLQSGKANSDIQLTAKAGQLEGGSDLVINQLEVEPLNAEKMAALQTQLSIPLETALGMLKDRNNQIKLTLPINGDMDNINVDPSDAINQAIGRAMKKGAKTYLATALFPFGTLLTLVEMAGDAAAKVQLDPIPFDPGSSQIKSDQHPYLEKVAQLLNDRPEIHIRLCGVTVESDRLNLQQQAEQKRAKIALEKQADGKEKRSEEVAVTQPPIEISDDQLNTLAVERTHAIESYLSERHSIKGERLISCQPRIESDKQKTTPRADLLI
ncbi:MAG: DUF748 domain-containing protein [Sedimenticola thiotaurini]|uniref:DUF748 domain-containing protein n=1 Tax=Sedimenticola thiotaurini TaxID=1543721 RepID=A0A558D6Y4_9GAMM|nr:MAG: DUF748 domain-containing protein [Sedimenticola thiotaurini]